MARRVLLALAGEGGEENERMAKAIAFAVASLAFATGCGDASPPGNAHTWMASEATDPTDELTAGFGWDEPITAGNFDPAAARPLGAAHTALTGHTLRQVITDATVRVRGDDKACVACHAWAATDTRTLFCARVPSFLAQPTSKGDGSDAMNAKPQLLKSLLSKWHDAGCP